MAELLPDNKSQRRAISNIIEWIKCFSMYIAVVSSKQPHRVPDLLGYLTLIMESHMEHAGEGWIGYDRRFRRRYTHALSKYVNCIENKRWQNPETEYIHSYCMGPLGELLQDKIP